MLRALWLVVAANTFAGLPRSAAQLQTATCLPTSTWAFNSLRQSPCTVAEYIGGVCNSGEFNVPALNSTEFYTGPTLETATPCRCSSIFYCLISACAVCQGNGYVRWSSWITNCSTAYPMVFPRDLPPGTAVPSWAYEDVTAYDMFNITVAQAMLAAPESVAPPVPTGTSTTTTPSATHTVTYPSRNANAGPIAGGVVGGVVFLGLIIALIIWLVQRRRDRTIPRAPDLDGDGTSPRPMSDVSAIGAISPYMAMQTPKFYDPSDPSTFPPVSPDTSLSYTSPSPQSGQPSYFNGPVVGHYAGTPEL